MLLGKWTPVADSGFGKGGFRDGMCKVRYKKYIYSLIVMLECPAHNAHKPKATFHFSRLTLQHEYEVGVAQE